MTSIGHSYLKWCDSLSSPRNGTACEMRTRPFSTLTTPNTSNNGSHRSSMVSCKSMGQVLLQRIYVAYHVIIQINKYKANRTLFPSTNSLQDDECRTLHHIHVTSNAAHSYSIHPSTENPTAPSQPNLDCIFVDYHHHHYYRRQSS